MVSTQIRATKKERCFKAALKKDRLKLSRAVLIHRFQFRIYAIAELENQKKDRVHEQQSQDNAVLLFYHFSEVLTI